MEEATLIADEAAFSSWLSGMTHNLRVKANDLIQDARLIEKAWEHRDVDALVQLNVIDPGQAVELSRLVGSAL